MAIILLDCSVIFDHLNGRMGRTEYLDELTGSRIRFGLDGNLCGAKKSGGADWLGGLRPGRAQAPV